MAKMKQPLAVVLLALCLSACSGLPPYQQAAAMQAQHAGLMDVKKSHFDVSYVLPDANLSQYKKIIRSDLDLSGVKITRTHSHAMDTTPWELNDKDKVFFQEQYTAAVATYLEDTGAVEIVSFPARDTLILQAKIIEIAPLGSKDDAQGRPSAVDVYTQGFGRMTLVFELYDSTTHKLLAMASDEQELGYLWEKNNRVQANVRIKLAFDAWLKKLSKEMPLWSAQ